LDANVHWYRPDRFLLHFWGRDGRPSAAQNIARKSANGHAEAVQRTMTVVGILVAPVLGLLIASSKTSFDTRSREIEQFSANLTLLDRELSHFGQEQKEIRALLRDFTARKIAQT
jgi:hypothetical protein